MFDTKSSFILSKLGIQRFQSQINNSNSEVLFGVLWGDILTLLDKSFNELETWLETIKNQSSNFIKIYLFGNKIDLDFKKQVFSSEIENFIDKSENENLSKYFKFTF